MHVCVYASHTVYWTRAVAAEFYFGQFPDFGVKNWPVKVPRCQNTILKILPGIEWEDQMELIDTKNVSPYAYLGSLGAPKSEIPYLRGIFNGLYILNGAEPETICHGNIVALDGWNTSLKK